MISLRATVTIIARGPDGGRLAYNSNLRVTAALLAGRGGKLGFHTSCTQPFSGAFFPCGAGVSIIAAFAHFCVCHDADSRCSAGPYSTGAAFLHAVFV